ncbi:DUF1329 domain-containing protein [Zhongshania marina]|uniref:DUF1329 domain-containing protein n=1 Tax=Zhongshania marina TaxID=2304603 RepID=A0A2S4HKG4_9GAMM|nr:DUF1329 domain-containing protein [Marortus luteolus]POP54473.1 hypothetical protein C0068_01420 [Marortus luteolus]
MHIRKYDFNYGRRSLLKKAALGASAGVLAPLFPLIARADDPAKAYPEELTSIEMLTKGKVKVGDVINANNVEYVKDLMDPITYMQIKDMGRELELVAPITDASKLFGHDMFEATIKNAGKAGLDKDGNVIVAATGEPWIGGMPFPDAKSGLEATANLTLSWGRNNFSLYAIRDWDIDPEGNVTYQYDFPWAELNATARVGSDGPYLEGKKDYLRYQSVWFTAPNDVAGTSFLNTWHYDQRKFPNLVGYLPAFRRVRTFPTNQRFEPLVPGISFFLSDAWSAGDPMLTWGNYKIVERKPFLGAIGNNWDGKLENWEKPVHGGPKGQSFFRTRVQLIPEVLVVDAEPTGYPRAPVGKKRTYIDVRNQMVVDYVTYDRRGDAWRKGEPSFGQFVDGDKVFKDGSGNTAWSFTHVQFHDVQNNRISRFSQTKEITGGYKSRHYQGDEDVYNKYLTSAAMQRLGQV